MELQKIAPELERQDVVLFAVSYDPVEALAAFAERHGIDYPLLSDVGSRVIGELGLRNEQIFAQHAAYNIPRNEEHYGVPYPGVFVLDQDGVAVDRRFYQSYRERETGVGLLENALRVASPRHGPESGSSTQAVTVRAYLDSPTFAYFQRLRLTLEVEIAPGYHVYGRGVREGYVPLSVTVDPIEGMTVGEADWPAPRWQRVAGLDEDMPVHEGRPRASLPLTFGLRPGSGDQTVAVSVAFQACDATDCLLPERVRLDLPVREVGLVDRPLPPRG